MKVSIPIHHQRIVINRVLVFLLVLGGFAFSCKKDAATAEADAKVEQDAALKRLGKSFERLKENNSELVDFRILKEALPEKFSGMVRADYNGQKSGFAGLSISSASAEYQDGYKTINISLLDTGGLGAAISTLASWSQIEIDKESDNGYERTTLIDGKKAVEKYDRTTKEGEISFLAADRFIVTVKGSNVEVGDLTKALTEIKIKG